MQPRNGFMLLTSYVSSSPQDETSRELKEHLTLKELHLFGDLYSGYVHR
jgi:hypothetical protein